MPIFLSPQDVESLEYELIPSAAKVKLTRLLGRTVSQLPIDDPDSHTRIRFLNRIINKTKNLTEKPVYVLESDDWGHFSACEIAWHESEFEVCIRRLGPVQFIEFLAEVVEEKYLTLSDANNLLGEADSSARLKEASDGKIRVSLEPLPGSVDLDEEANPNLRTVISRMENSIKDGDYASVLHSSALAIETISKERMDSQGVNDQTFGSYVEGYRKRSKLPDPIINWMLEIYNRRSAEPLAGHGQLAPPTISGDEAVLIAEMTKAFVRFERWASIQEVTRNS